MGNPRSPLDGKYLQVLIAKSSFVVVFQTKLSDHVRLTCASTKFPQADFFSVWSNEHQNKVTVKILRTYF